MKEYKEMKKKEYTLILYEDEFGDWVCEIDEIKGLIGVGNTPSEALRELSEFVKVNELTTLKKELENTPKLIHKEDSKMVMVENFITKLKEETENLIVKVNKLHDFMATKSFYKLSRVEKDLLYDQQSYMIKYLQILGKRCEYYGVTDLRRLKNE